MIPYKMKYSINMHTTVYQFWRFVYHHEQSVMDQYAVCTNIIIYVIILYEDKIARILSIIAPKEMSKEITEDFFPADNWRKMSKMLSEVGFF